MRGTQVSAPGFHSRFRSIPAHAGNTVCRQVLPKNGRSIPAHAGNTGVSSYIRYSRAVHPRACGEHVDPSGIFMSCGGPSPRMRGTPARRRCSARRARSIPAHAGNTKPGSTIYGFHTVHPRACGEHVDEDEYALPADGPSPRMRGTPHLLVQEDGGPRSIPAHAGNTPKILGYRSFWSVHPRACGEHHPLPPCCLGFPGPSPRMRGTQQKGVLMDINERSIPAHAGNTSDDETR